MKEGKATGFAGAAATVCLSDEAKLGMLLLPRVGFAVFYSSGAYYSAFGF